VDRTGSGSCPVAGFGISGVETSGSATRELVIFHCITTNCVCASVRVCGLCSIDQAKRERPIDLCSLHNRTKMRPGMQAKWQSGDDEMGSESRYSRIRSSFTCQAATYRCQHLFTNELQLTNTQTNEGIHV
jgi:hypothetical protein